MRSWHLSSLALLVFAAPIPGLAQAPYLVRDINEVPSQEERDPRSLTAGSSALYFVGGGDANGREIRRLSTSLQLTLPLDLQPGQGSGNDAPETLAAAGDILYFEFKQGLYRTDGTPAGTTLVRQFGPDFVQLDQLTGVGTGLFLIEATNLGKTLWWSDGTPAGTIPLVAVDTFVTLTAAGGRVFWVASEAATGAEPWTSDGTVAGTHLLKDICPGPCLGISPLGEFADVAGTLYFAGDDGVHGSELWKSDGTGAGTVMVADAMPGFEGQGPRRLAAFGNLVLYQSLSGPDSLWRSDGSAAGTHLLRSGVEFQTIVDAGGISFFDGTETATGREIWRTDGTAAGTAAIDMCPGPCSFIPFAPAMGSAPGVLVFTRGNGELWRSDGTTGGTYLLRTFDTLPQSFTRFAGEAFFAARDGVGGRELWRSDGSVAGTQVVHDHVNVSSWVLGLTHVGDRFFFDAIRPDLGPELWSTTGTPASTTFVDLLPGPEGDFPRAWAPLTDRLVVGTSGQGGPRIWGTDGSAAGTVQVASATANYMGVANGLAFFDGGSPPGNGEPWRSDGTAGGTFKLAELQPGQTSSFPLRFVAYRDRMFFSASAPTRSLWKSDGTAAGTMLVVPQECYPMTAVADILYLQCGSTFNTLQLWASDGTAAGTRLVKDIRPLSVINEVFDSAELNGILYFAARDSADDYELWRSDGTDAGTYRVKDIVPGPDGSSPFMFEAVGGALYFMATTAATGFELWRSDGTDMGTVMVRDLNAGPGRGVFEIEAAGGQLVLSAYTPANGMEPWRSDGTNTGTVPMPEIAPGPSSSVPYDLHAVGGRIYFAADDGVTGVEPWAVVMPPGVVTVGDTHIQEGDSGTLDATFEVRLESATLAPMQVAYTTVAGTAQAGVDFQPRSGVLTFAPGATLATVAVPVVGDLQDEADETFRLDLSPVGGTVISDASAFVVILDDDAPRLTIANATVTEGDAGATNASFSLTLTTRDGTPTPSSKTIGFSTAPLTATAGVDFVSAAGTFTFPAGTVSGTTVEIQVAVNGDLIDEPDETFELRLAATSDATVPSVPALGLIEDDDGIDSARPTELSHGLRLRAALRPPAGRVTDRDLYVLVQQPWASYEVVADETSGDAIPLEVRRLAADGTTVLQSATAVGTGGSVSLRWQNAGAATVTDQHLRVESAACGTACGDDDTYRLRFYETTLSSTRFNNAGGQVTVVLLQNTTDATVNGRLILWAPEGLFSSPNVFAIPAHGLLVVNTATIWTDGSGSLTVTHDGPYGSLVGKAVALEPATGFSFDTPLTCRPR